MWSPVDNTVSFYWFSCQTFGFHFPYFVPPTAMRISNKSFYHEARYTWYMLPFQSRSSRDRNTIFFFLAFLNIGHLKNSLGNSPFHTIEFLSNINAADYKMNPIYSAISKDNIFRTFIVHSKFSNISNILCAHVLIVYCYLT